MKAFLLISLSMLMLAACTKSSAEQNFSDKNLLASRDAELMRQGMWRDPKTNMVWMRCSLGQTWDGSTCTGGSSKHQWQAAQDAVAVMNRNGGYGGYTDWVLPHIEDLSSIRYCSTGFEETVEIPAKKDSTKTIPYYCKGEGYQRPNINHTIFPNTPSQVYWSSSPNAGDNNYAWQLSFYYGNLGLSGKYSLQHVRAVRTGQ